MTERILGDQELQNNIDNFLYKHMNGLALKPGAIKEAKDSLYQLVVESQKTELEDLVQYIAYGEYNTSPDDAEIGDIVPAWIIRKKIDKLQSQISSIGESNG